MKIFRMSYIPYRCKGDVPILKAFCHFKLGEYFKALQLVNRVKSTPSITLTNEYRIIYSMLEGMINASDKNNEEAVDCFENALFTADAKNKSTNIFLPVYYLEYGAMLFSIGKREKAQGILKKGIEYCEEVHFDFYKGIMQKVLLSGCEDDTQFPFPKVDLDLEAIVEIAKQGVTLNKLHKKIRDIEFLNKLQEMASAKSNRQTIAEDYLNLININFPCEIALLYDIEAGCGRCLASKFITDIHIENPISFIEELDTSQGPQLLNLMHNYGGLQFKEEFSSVINIPVRTDCGKIVGLFLATTKKDTFFSNDDLNILYISMKQIETIFTKLEQDQALLYMSRTDLLTGLNNRQALQAKLEEEMKKIKNLKDGQKVDLSVMFLDLDNFKYYNDTYGHDMGDVIIKAFGEMLRREFITPNFVARFGGDEFVAILPGADETTAVATAERVISNIFGNNSFKIVVERALGYPVDIPDDKVITCSAGIAGYKFIEHQDNNLNTLLHNADMALYKAKSSGKNAIKVF